MLTGKDISFQPLDYRAPLPDDYLLCFHENTVLLSGAMGPSAALPAFSTLEPFLSKDSTPFLCFSLTSGNLYVLDTKASIASLEKTPLSYMPVQIFRELFHMEAALLLISAWHLAVWQRRNRFCGACGSLLFPSPSERALVCKSCEQTVYPTISPAISVAITDKDYLLLARNARASFSHFSLVAGYVEIGETLEETVMREVMEEVGLKIKNIRYTGSQAWGLSQTEMVGFTAELEGSNQIRLQTSELSEARWFHRNEITPNPEPLSLSFDMIEKFRTRML